MYLSQARRNTDRLSQAHGIRADNLIEAARRALANGTFDSSPG